MRIVLIEPSHWHFAMYRDGIVQSGAEVVGVIDANPRIASEIADAFGCPVWADLNRMLDELQPDFAFAFGAHALMPSIAEKLIARQIPFSIEKPCGTGVADVQRIRLLAEKAGLFVSVPFHYRISALADALRSCTALPSAEFLAWDIRINAGSPLRYTESSPWLVHPNMAGGGCMMNLAHHAIDFILQCSGASVVSVSAQASNKFLGLPIEDQASLELAMSDGSIATINTGYTHPVTTGSYMDFDFYVVHRDFSADRHASGLMVTNRSDGPQLLPTTWLFKKHFADYAQQTLARIVAVEPPIASLVDLQATVRVVTAAYESIQTGSVIQLATAVDASQLHLETNNA